MRYLRKYSKCFLIIIIPAICWLFINSFINGHYHKLNNGEIVYHCHPFTHNKNNTSPFEDHRHTESECFFLAQISNPLVILFLFLILIGQFITLCIDIILYRYSYHVMKSFFYDNNYRAPPVFN